jgi:aspartate aminotransferase-like enzyme
MFKIMDDIQEGLRYLFQTDSKYTLMMTGSGHAGMEACIANLLEPGDKIVVGNNGIWGARVVDLAGRYGGEAGTGQAAGAAARCGSHCSCFLSTATCVRTCTMSSCSSRQYQTASPGACMPAHGHHCGAHPSQSSRQCADMPPAMPPPPAADVTELATPAGTTFSFDTLKAAVEQHKPKVLFLVQGESSAGTHQSLAGLGEMCKANGTMLVVDTVCTLGGVPMFADKWGVDAIYSGSQKCLSGPPGGGGGQGSRQQAAGSRQQAAGSRQQAAGSRQQAAGSRQQH